jgi:hypothetical protein
MATMAIRTRLYVKCIVHCLSFFVFIHEDSVFDLSKMPAEEKTNKTKQNRQRTNSTLEFFIDIILPAALWPWG